MTPEFPQYSAIVEETGERPNVTVTIRCPVCKKALAQRTWLGFEQQPPDAEIEIIVDKDGARRVAASNPELQVMLDARLKDAAKDREDYWAHLSIHLGDGG